MPNEPCWECSSFNIKTRFIPAVGNDVDHFEYMCRDCGEIWTKDTDDE